MLRAIGHAVLAGVAFFGDLVELLVDTVGCLVRGRFGGARTVIQMAEVGADSAPIVVVTLLFGGMVLSLHTAYQLVQYGQGRLVGGLVAVSMAREVGPVLASIVVAARAGSAMAAELGSMKLTEQVDALRAMGVSLTAYLVVPRVVAAVVMMPLVAILGEVTGAIGGYVVGVYSGVTSAEYIQATRDWLRYPDLFGGLAKTVVFGLIIALVGCYQGLRTSPLEGAAGVGHSATRSVVLSILLIYASDYFLSAIIFRIWP